MFSIDRVFRNETLDATHLAEFHQVEGVVAERNLSLAHVIGLFTEFFRKCGTINCFDSTNLFYRNRKSAFQANLQPIHGAFHGNIRISWWTEEMGGDWQLGHVPARNASAHGTSWGCCCCWLWTFFREVFFWKLFFKFRFYRPTMIRYGLSNIRELFGHKIDLQMVYNNPICQLDKKDWCDFSFIYNTLLLCFIFCSKLWWFVWKTIFTCREKWIGKCTRI